MSDIKTREFYGFTIEDSENHIFPVNTRDGVLNLNCQEIIALAISENCIFGNGQEDNDIVQVFKREISFVSHSSIYKCRKSDKWVPAVDSFEKLNPGKIEESGIRILPQTNGNSSGNSEVKIKFTATHAGNLGKAIFEALPTEHKKYLSNFDLSNSAYAEDTNMGRIVRRGIGYFTCGIFSEVGNILHEIREKQAREAELEKQAKQAKLETKAAGMLSVMGIVKPTDKDSESYDTDLEEYTTKLQGLLAFLAEDTDSE